MKRSNKIKKNSASSVDVEKKKKKSGKTFSLLNYPSLVFLVPIISWFFIFSKRESLDVSIFSSEFSRVLLNCICHGSFFLFLVLIINLGIDHINLFTYLMIVFVVSIYGWFETRKVFQSVLFCIMLLNVVFVLTKQFIVFYAICAFVNWYWLKYKVKSGDQYEFAHVF